MRSDSLIAVRDQIDLFYDKSPDYKSQIQDILKDGTLLVTIPSYLGVPMSMQKGQELSMAFYRASGRYVVDIRVIGFKENKAVRFAMLEVLTEPVKEQRRSFYRLPISVKTLICRYPEDEREYRPIQPDTEDDEVLETARTSNLSISGIGLKTRQRYEAGERYLLKVYLGWPHAGAPPLTICGEVKRVNDGQENDTYNIGMHFVDHNESMGEFVGKFILLQQQKQIKQKRLVEGE